ncbi:MAG: hypothetical protein KDA70_21045 [Planctomycetaceae bacterium]|nr:hypothetical protein [Planctomycetaceae bacterium]MCA9022533.1 hypothetical protein [Planctomycetaceae bacterium]
MPLLISSRSFYRHSDQVTLVKNADYSNYFGNPNEAGGFNYQKSRFLLVSGGTCSLLKTSSEIEKAGLFVYLKTDRL